MLSSHQLIGRLLGRKSDLLDVAFTAGGRTVHAYVPGEQQWIAVKEILLNREYEYLPGFELEAMSGRVVVDIGAHVGLYTLLAACFAKKVIAVEAWPDNARLLKLNVERNGFDHVVVVEKALVGERKGSRQIARGADSAEGSIAGGAAAGEGHRVEDISLAELLAAHGPVDLMKCDVEGAEFEILEHTPSRALEKVGRIVGELHPNYGDPERAVAALRSAGFTVELFRPPLVARGKGAAELQGLWALKGVRRLLYALPRSRSVEGYSGNRLFFAQRG